MTEKKRWRANWRAPAVDPLGLLRAAYHAAWECREGYQDCRGCGFRFPQDARKTHRYGCPVAQLAGLIHHLEENPSALAHAADHEFRSDYCPDHGPDGVKADRIDHYAIVHDAILAALKVESSESVDDAINAGFDAYEEANRDR